MHICICVYISLSLYIYIYIHIHPSIHPSIHPYIHTYSHINIYSAHVAVECRRPLRASRAVTPLDFARFWVAPYLCGAVTPLDFAWFGGGTTCLMLLV